MTNTLAPGWRRSEMWPLASELLAGSLVVALDQVAAAVHTMVERNRVVAEGAGAVSVAAALAGMAGSGKIVCVTSGGNMDSEKLRTILAGRHPMTTPVITLLSPAVAGGEQAEKWV